MLASAADEGSVTLVSDDSKTNSLTLAQSESAKLTFSRFVQIEGTNPQSGIQTETVDLRIGLGDRSYLMRANAASPVVISGPAVITVRNVQAGDLPFWRNFATFAVTRIGTASPPAEVPQEAGSNFDVILEQSSDLVNWTPANPGAYSGTETKRFFRTRIVKKQ
jgi:hypothetical protein